VHAKASFGANCTSRAGPGQRFRTPTVPTFVAPDPNRVPVFCQQLLESFPQSGTGRRDADPNWYPLMAATDLVQGSGRAVRTAADIAPTYILDAQWRYWYPAHQNLFPPYWRKCSARFPPVKSHGT
jgi:hypothetical protein